MLLWVPLPFPSSIVDNLTGSSPNPLYGLVKIAHFLRRTLGYDGHELVSRYNLSAPSLAVLT